MHTIDYDVGGRRFILMFFCVESNLHFLIGAVDYVTKIDFINVAMETLHGKAAETNATTITRVIITRRLCTGSSNFEYSKSWIKYYGLSTLLICQRIRQ